LLPKKQRVCEGGDGDIANSIREASSAGFDEKKLEEEDEDLEAEVLDREDEEAPTRAHREDNDDLAIGTAILAASSHNGDIGDEAVDLPTIARSVSDLEDAALEEAANAIKEAMKAAENAIDQDLEDDDDSSQEEDEEEDNTVPEDDTHDEHASYATPASKEDNEDEAAIDAAIFAASSSDCEDDEEEDPLLSQVKSTSGVE